MKLDWKTCIRVGVTVVLVYICIHYWSGVSSLLGVVMKAFSPLITGAVLAYPLNILMSFYERHILVKAKKKIAVKCRRGICLVLTLTTLVGIVAGVFALVIPQLIVCVESLVAEVPGAVERLLAFVQQYDIIPDDIFATLSQIDWQSKLVEYAGTITSGLGSAVDVVFTTVTSVATAVTNGVIAVVFAVYLLLSKDRVLNQINRISEYFISEKIYSKIRYVLSTANVCFRKFIAGQCIEAFILGALCTIGMLILGLPYAAMMGAVMMVTALIPIVGGFIGGGIGTFLLFVEKPIDALIFLIFTILLQQIEGDLIYPKVVGNSIGLPGIWVFSAVTVGAGFLGITGIFISVPIAATIYRLLGNELKDKPVLTGRFARGKGSERAKLRTQGNQK